MQTIRTISNISYNSLEFFEKKIKDLVLRGIIDWAYWIQHQPDSDEKRVHIHFVVKPAKRVDTSSLRDEFKEFDPLHPDKPLCCTAKWFNTNSMDDWLLYAVHDPAYLTSKGQRRNVLYQYKDLRATDYDALSNDWNAIDRAKYQRLKWLYDAVEGNVPFARLVQDGLIPIAQRQQYEFQYNALLALKREERTNRINSHEEEIELETGEIISPVKGIYPAGNVEF